MKATNDKIQFLQVYEILRCFYPAIQVTPFLFEDFCCALRSPNQSRLLCEIHVALIRLIFRDDDETQTMFAVSEINVSFNALIQMIEPMTFAEVNFLFYSYTFFINLKYTFCQVTFSSSKITNKQGYFFNILSIEMKMNYE